MSQTFDKKQTSNSITPKEKYMISSTITMLLLIIASVQLIIEATGIKLRMFWLFIVIAVCFGAVAIKNYSRNYIVCRKCGR